MTDYSQIVSVQLLEDASRPADYRRFIRVEVYSLKPCMVGKLKKQKDIFPHEHSSMAGFRRGVESTAAKAAMELCVAYGDALDPAECAKMAVEKFDMIERVTTLAQAPPQERGEGEQ